MHSVYEELIAFDGLEEAVGRLYKAYLDTRLMEFESATHGSDPDPASGAAGKPADNDAYWQQVKQFRKQSLDPFTALASPAPGDDDDSDSQKDARRELIERAKRLFAGGKAQFEYARYFLYWYDIRAQFWVDNRPSGERRKTLMPARALKHLHEQAVELETRLKQYAEHYDKPYDPPVAVRVMVATAKEPAPGGLLKIVSDVKHGSIPPSTTASTSDASSSPGT